MIMLTSYLDNGKGEFDRIKNEFDNQKNERHKVEDKVNGTLDEKIKKINDRVNKLTEISRYEKTKELARSSSPVPGRSQSPVPKRGGPHDQDPEIVVRNPVYN